MSHTPLTPNLEWVQFPKAPHRWERSWLGAKQGARKTGLMSPGQGRKQWTKIAGERLWPTHI